jgi:SagB-type dehydrogenase family enzyme
MSFEGGSLKRPGDPVWELFHENSKTSRVERHSVFALPPSDAAVVNVMRQLRTVKPYRDRPKLALPRVLPAATRGFDEILTERTSGRGFDGRSINLPELAKVLYMAYGVTRDNEGTSFPRPFRTIPSGGALYPLEIYLHASNVEGLSAGLYHYDPEAEELDILHQRNDSAELAGYMVQADLLRSAAAVLFISAVFLRSTFKYGDRGYRFVFLEAGHLAQNAVLTATELGLTATPIGGYFDRKVDDYLALDGLEESVIYILLLGR